MPFIQDLQIKQDGTSRNNYTPTRQQRDAAALLPTQQEIIMTEILTRANLLNADAQVRYDNLRTILQERDNVSNDIAAAGLREDVSVIGGVTEMICEIGLQAAAPNRYAHLPNDWKWLGDYAITGLPFNLYVSVKSYYARERLIASGTGQGAAPIIGYGLFKDEGEWSPKRVHQYRHRGFVAVYMPTALYTALSQKVGRGYPATDILNIYNRPLLRDINDFANDLSNVVQQAGPDRLIIDLQKF